MVTNKSLLVVLLNPDSAYISQVALNDRMLPAKELGVLVFLCNAQPNQSPVKLIGDRFGYDRTWWYRRFKVLQKLGYAKFHKTSKGYNKFESFYIVTDDPAQLIDFDIETMKTRSNTPVKTTEIEIQPYHERPKRTGEKTYMSKQQRVREQMKWVDPLITGQADYELHQFYLNHGYPIPSEPLEWEEAKQPGMQLFAEVTRHYPGWMKAQYINAILGATPNRAALQSAWINWIAHDFKPGNVKGILDWYKAFCTDPQAEPWQRRRSDKNGRHTNSRRQSRKEHGTASQNNTDTEFVTID